MLFTFLFYGKTILWLCCSKQPQLFRVRERSGFFLKFLFWLPQIRLETSQCLFFGHQKLETVLKTPSWYPVVSHLHFWNTVSNCCHWLDHLLAPLSSCRLAWGSTSILSIHRCDSQVINMWRKHDMTHLTQLLGWDHICQPHLCTDTNDLMLYKDKHIDPPSLMEKTTSFKVFSWRLTLMNSSWSATCCLRAWRLSPVAGPWGRGSLITQCCCSLVFMPL